MTESERVIDQLDRAVNGPAWHGPALMEILSDVTASEAAHRPEGSAHSIWEIVLHLVTWHWVVADRLHGQEINELADDVDWPPVPPAATEAWRQAADQLRESYEALREAIVALPVSRYDEQVPGRSYSFYVMLHGVVQHDLYHAGQIILLKKQARAAVRI